MEQHVSTLSYVIFRLLIFKNTSRNSIYDSIYDYIQILCFSFKRWSKIEEFEIK
jgi:hypothetical protein